jgi:hypothetical protein
VQPVTVAEVADELYTLPPAEFTAARDERARQVRAGGQRDEAAAIRKLARPTASAWLVNQLVRAAPDQLDRLAEVGEALGEAQRTLAGDRLRELSGERRQIISELLPRAAEIAGQAGQPASQVVLGEVRATLEAALADPGARAAVQSGRLTKALTYAGIGEVDLAAALALPAEPGQTGPRSRLSGQAARRGRATGGSAGKAAGRPAQDGGRSARQAEEPGAGEEADRHAAGLAQRASDALRAAEAAVAEAEQAVADAGQHQESVAEQRQFLQRRIDHLEREIRQARQEGEQLDRDAQQARRSQHAAARQLESARRQLARVQQRSAAK